MRGRCSTEPGGQSKGHSPCEGLWRAFRWGTGTHSDERVDVEHVGLEGGKRQLRRSVGTSNGEPLGRVPRSEVERVARHLDGVDRSIGEVREWLAFREGERTPRPPFWTPEVSLEEQGIKERLGQIGPGSTPVGRP